MPLLILVALVRAVVNQSGISTAPVIFAMPAPRISAPVSTSLYKKRSESTCIIRTIDDFQRGTALFDVRTNSVLSPQKIEAGTRYALPRQAVAISALQARAQAPSQGQTFGRSFPIPQNWSKANGIGFWYYGHKTRKPIDVEVRANQAADPGSKNWTLRWSDEFNGQAGTPPNPAVWSFDRGDGNGSGWGNHELEYYTDKLENASQDGAGHLVITARSVPPGSHLMCYYGPCRYTSARLLTQHKFEVGYGRIEARMKVPGGSGLWPAFWALGSNIDSVGWPASGEIDVMENVGREPNRVHGTIHGPGYSGANGLTGSYDTPAPLSADFHTFTVEWQPNRITWYIDGIQYHTAGRNDVSPNKWVYNHPFFLVLNLAVGGDFGGPVASDVSFPQSLVVDYVRVYSPSDTAERFRATFADTFSGWKRISLPFQSFHRADEQPAGAPNGALSLRSVSGYTFSVPPGTPDPILVSGVYLEGIRIQGSCRAK